MDAGRHPLIDVVSNAEVIGCEGRPGDFRVRIRKKPRYVREDKCVACGLCVDACPQVGGNEFDVGLKARKAIYRPFPQSVPATYVIDSDACLNLLGFLSEKQRLRLAKVQKIKQRKREDYQPNLLVCGHCSKACEVDAIDFDMRAEEMEVDVGAVLVAVGFMEFDARKLGNYGYGRFPNVVTSLELERMLNASGVTQGHVVRPSDMKTPKRMVFIQCVGARGEGGRPYCSRFCCMNAVKDSMLVRQHDPEVEDVTILYTDLRAFGKGFDDFVQRSRDEKSATYVRGRPAKVDHVAEDDSLEIFVEDTLGHSQERIPADLVVLSVAAAPNEGAMKVADILGIETDVYGFIARRDPAVSAVETTREGIYVAGSAVGPQVIPDCVAQASAAAARAALYLTGYRVEEEQKTVDPMDLSGPPRVGVMVCHCGVNIAGTLDVEQLASHAAKIPDVVAAETNLFACSSAGQDRLVELIKEHNINRVVIAACTPRTHEPIFQETCARIGFNPYLLEMVNIRDQCSWVHAGQTVEAQEKAKALIRMGVAKARHLHPLQAGEVPMARAALVIGGGIGGIQAATDLAAQGFPVTLVEKTDRLGGRLAKPNLKSLYPNMRPAAEVLREKVDRLKSTDARILLNTEVEEISGFVGNFEVTTSGATQETFPVGAIVLATGAELHKPRGEYGYGTLPNVLTSEELEHAFFEEEEAVPGDSEDATSRASGVGGNKRRSGERSDGKAASPFESVGSASFILCVGSRDPECFSGCSRYCCPTAIKQAILLAKRGIDTTIFYRDIRTISSGAEEMYREARGLGVLFIRIPPGEKVEVIGEKRAEGVRCFDDLLGRRVEVPTDLVVLSVGMRPRQPETDRFHDMLKASIGLDGFFLERHPELAPIETAVEGVLLAGTIQGPKDIVDTVAQASAAAAKASVFLAYDKVKLDPVTAVVDALKCRGCGTCVDICPYHAGELVESGPGVYVAEINASLCKGCGTCGSWCPSGAITCRHFTDRQVHAMIDAFFGEEVTT
ncbi:MAG: CoB--CoM heterodisulfide reductase iron-sulfur subunit A family protein [Phycisphaerales bacterium]|nr:MAG: CoB--CoM heterodisulfide reductase iron-sulfur subunit A family protein [Phycisphaerales bacterium]